MSSASRAISGWSACARSMRPKPGSLFMRFLALFGCSLVGEGAMVIYLRRRIKMGAGMGGNRSCPSVIPDLVPSDHSAMTESIASAIHLQRGNKTFLRDVDLTELPHLLLAFLLLLQKFSFARDVAAVAFCGDVLAQRAHGFPRNHLAADCGLDRNLEHVRRDQFLHLLDHGAAAAFRALAGHPPPERLHAHGVDQVLHLDQGGR